MGLAPSSSVVCSPSTRISRSSYYLKNLLTTASSNTLRKVRFANSMLNSFEFSLRTLNDRSLKPMTCTDKPPDGDNQEYSQHYHRSVVEALEGYGSGRWQHKQH